MNTSVRCACDQAICQRTTNQQFHLVRIPDGPLTRDCFKLAVAAVPGLKDGEVLLKNRLVSVDAANRAWMHGATYRDATRGRHGDGGARAWGKSSTRATRDSRSETWRSVTAAGRNTPPFRERP